MLIIALIGGLAGGGMFAYFSDTETSTDNVFQAGSIDISLSGDVGQSVHGVLPKDWKPCQTGYLVFDVTNDGDNPADVWKHILNLERFPGWTSSSEQKEDPGDLINDIDTVIHFGMWIEDTSDDTGPENDYHTFNAGDDVMLVDEDIDGLYLSDVVCKFMYLGELAVGETITVVQTFHMDADTTNWAQGDYLEWDEDYVAQQVNNPDPPGPELPQCARP
jgi:predicted ribosomally synthesized peptide with SipW-like signal peptide